MSLPDFPPVPIFKYVFSILYLHSNFILIIQQVRYEFGPESRGETDPALEAGNSRDEGRAEGSEAEVSDAETGEESKA